MQLKARTINWTNSSEIVLNRVLRFRFMHCLPHYPSTLASFHWTSLQGSSIRWSKDSIRIGIRTGGRRNCGSL